MKKSKITPPIGENARPLMPIFAGSILAKARKITVNRVTTHYKGKPIIAIDADGEVYRFDSAAAVEQQIRISASRIQNAISNYKKGKREAPLVEGFCWLKEEDKGQWMHKVQAWIALNAQPNPNTRI